VAGAGLASIAVALALARPEPIAIPIVVGWVVLTGSALLRAVHTVVSVTVRPEGIESRALIGLSRFAAWSELGTAQMQGTAAGRELRIVGRSGRPVAVLTDRISSFDGLVQAIRAHLTVNADDGGPARAGPLANVSAGGTTWTIRTARSIDDAFARCRETLASQGYRIEEDERGLWARSGLVVIDLWLTTDHEGSLVTIAHRSGIALLVVGAAGVAFTLLALGGLALAGRTSLVGLAAVLLVGQVVGVLLWRRAADDRARQTRHALERALAGT
jgi:hypothetical protein